MRKEKFVYNTQTLQYEEVVEPLSIKLLRVFGFTCAAVFTGFLFMLLAHRFFPSPNERSLLGENDKLRAEITKMGTEVDQMSEALSNIQERDAYAHRVVFEMDPIDENIWNGGIGGHDRYKEYRQLKYSGETLAKIKEKSDRLRQQLLLQSNSLDTILTAAKNKKDMLAAIPAIKPVRSDKLARNVKLLSGFGYRIHPIYKVKKMHAGIDFTAPRGTPIQATGKGKVVKVGRGSGYGLRVIIDHGFGYQTLYAHMDRIDVKVGDQLNRGQKIGIVGSTGASTAPHCHYEVMHKGTKVNPIQFVTDGLSPEEYQELVRLSETVNQSLH